MQNQPEWIRKGRTIAALAVTAVCLAAAGTTVTATPGPRPEAQAKVTMATHASGTFDVKLTPQTPDDSALGRLIIDKTFHGGLEGTSKGQMLAAATEIPGSAGYVAMERVTGALSGRTGTFVLQHSGTMTRGEPTLVVTVVPDSGTGQLVGLAGRLVITIVEKKHLYEFDYTLPEP